MLAETIARLQAEAPILRLVEGAAELAALKALPPRMPAAYVIPLAEAAQPNTRAGVHHQRIEAAIGVVLFVKGERADPKGGAQVVALEDVRDQVGAALLGWPPFEGASGLDFVAGDLLGFGDQVVRWQDTYETHFARRARRQP